MTDTKITRSFFISISFIFLFLSNNYTQGQEKKEFEKRLKPEQVPTQAINWVSTVYTNPKRVKWYKEYNENNSSIEAKFKWKGKHQSVEFDSLGKFEDLEITIKFKDIPDSAKSKIKDYLLSAYPKYKIQKVQRQITGSSQVVSEFLQSNIINTVNPKTTIKYEIVYFGKTDKTNTLWEGLFDENGNFLSKLKVVLPTIDNLTF